MKLNIQSYAFGCLLVLLMMAGSNLKAQNVICPGEQVSVTLDMTRGAIQWQSSTLPASSWTDLAGETADSLVITPGGNVSYRAYFITEQDCDTVFSDAIEFEISDLTADAGADVTYCDGESANLGGMPAASGGDGSYTFSWNPSAALSSGVDPNPTTTANADVQYVLAVTDGNGCMAFDTVDVTVEAVTHDSMMFMNTGAVQVFVVPNCIDSLFIELWGAAGANGTGNLPGFGAEGGYVSGTMHVNPGETLWVYVGDNVNAWPDGGTGGSGGNAGGNGGGSSSVRYIMDIADSTKAVAGGGGGGGACGTGAFNMFSAGPGGFVNYPQSFPGGADNGVQPTAQGGGGAGQAVGGASGAGNSSNCGGAAGNGIVGTALQGGNGGDGTTTGCPYSGAGGGGGGGGWFGGGGGGGGAGEGVGGWGGGGGGGGSSYTDGLMNSNTTGFSLGQGQVQIHW
ncbi:MAG: hypothetical protein AAF570_04045 [Bacteroidota bacterium]